jgi:hypothetical protein
MKNIGARRLHTVLTTLLEDLLFDLPDVEQKNVRIDDDTVRNRLKDIVEDEDLRRFILLGRQAASYKSYREGGLPAELPFRYRQGSPARGPRRRFDRRNGNPGAGPPGPVQFSTAARSNRLTVHPAAFRERSTRNVRAPNVAGNRSTTRAYRWGWSPSLQSIPEKATITSPGSITHDPSEAREQTSYPGRRNTAARIAPAGCATYISPRSHPSGSPVPACTLIIAGWTMGCASNCRAVSRWTRAAA